MFVISSRISFLLARSSVVCNARIVPQFALPRMNSCSFSGAPRAETGRVWRRPCPIRLTHVGANGTLRAAHSDGAPFACSGALDMLEAIDHIGFAVRDIDESIAFYSAMFGVTAWERIAQPEQYMDV